MPEAADLPADGVEPAAAAGSGSRDSLYRRMLLIRRFEERVYRLFLEGEIPGTLHQYQGQEAVAVGVCDALTRDDWITSTHRPHGHALAKGVSDELYDKVVNPIALTRPGSADVLTTKVLDHKARQ